MLYLHVLSDGAAFTTQSVVHREATQTAVIIAERYLRFHNIVYIVCDFFCIAYQRTTALCSKCCKASDGDLLLITGFTDEMCMTIPFNNRASSTAFEAHSWWESCNLLTYSLAKINTSIDLHCIQDTHGVHFYNSLYTYLHKIFHSH